MTTYPTLYLPSGVTVDSNGNFVYPANVAQWAPILATILPPEQIDRAEWIIARESGGNPNAQNPQGVTSPSDKASGLFQYLPSNNNPLGMSLFNPLVNIWLSVKELGLGTDAGVNQNWAATGANYPYSITPSGVDPGTKYPNTIDGFNQWLSDLQSMGFNVQALNQIGGTPNSNPSPPDAGSGAGAAGGAVAGAVETTVCRNLFLLPACLIIKGAKKTGQSISSSIGGISDLISVSFKVLGWLTDPKHWIKLFVISFGVILVILGVGTYAYGMLK